MFPPSLPSQKPNLNTTTRPTLIPLLSPLHSSSSTGSGVTPLLCRCIRRLRPRVQKSRLCSASLRMSLMDTGSRAFSLYSALPRLDCNIVLSNNKTHQRVDSIWGAWFFFSFYFKPSLNAKSKAKSQGQKRCYMEVQYGRHYSRGDMYPITHKKKDRSFVNEEAREKYEQLHNEIQETSSKNEAFLKVFGKEHLGYVRGMGLGVTPTQIIGSYSSSARSGSSLDVATIAQLR